MTESPKQPNTNCPSSTLFWPVLVFVLLSTTTLPAATASPGTILWTVPQTNFANGVGFSPTGAVLFMGDQGLTAVSTSGSVLWSTNIPYNGKGSLAVSTNGTVYSQAGGLFAVDASGNVTWTLSSVSGGNNGPAIASDGTIYVGGEDSNLVAYVSALNPNGTTKWSTQVDAYGSFPVIGPDGTIYTVGGNHAEALNPNGTIKWAYYSATNRFDYVPAVGPDGVLYVSGDLFYALDSSGHLKWANQPGGFSYPVLGQDGTIYFSGSRERTNIYCLNGNGTTNRILSLGPGLSLAQPAIGPDGSIYVDASSGTFPNTSDTLFCLTPAGTTNWQIPLAGSILDTPIIGPDDNLYFLTLNFSNRSSTVYAIRGNAGSSPSPWSSVRGDFRNSGQAPHTSPTPPLVITLTNRTSSGIASNSFGFLFSGVTDLDVVVEASTNLVSPTWLPIATNALKGGTAYFSDPFWTNYSGRLYRLRSQ